MKEITDEHLKAFADVITTGNFQDEFNARVALARECLRLREERKRLREIVSKLPVTADGVPIVPGMNVFSAIDQYLGPTGVQVITYVGRRGGVYVSDDGRREWNASCFYSTHAAALAASPPPTKAAP